MTWEGGLSEAVGGQSGVRLLPRKSAAAWKAGATGERGCGAPRWTQGASLDPIPLPLLT